MANGNSTIIFVSSIEMFFQRVKSYFIQFITKQVAGDRAHCALASVFCVYWKGGGLIVKY